MADGESLLGAQLSAAVRIPYENIAVANNPANTFINAWQFSTQMKLKKAELEDKMAALVMRNRQLEINDQLREKEYGLRALGMQNAMAHRDDMYELAATRLVQERELGQERINTAAARFNDAHQKELNRNEAQQDLFSLDGEMEAEGYHKGTKEYETEYLKRVGDIASKLPTSEANAVYRATHGNLQAAALQQQRLNDNDLRMFRQKFGSEVFGNPGIQDLRPLDDPASLPDAAPKQLTWWQRHVEGKKQEPTQPGLKTISVTDPQTGKVTAVGTATVKKLTDLNTEYQALLDRQAHSATPRDVPDAGVYRPTNTLREKALRIQSDPTASDQAKVAAEKYLKENP